MEEEKSEEIKLELTPEVVDMTEIETALTTDRKVEEKEVEKSLNYEALSETEKKAIDEFIEKIDISDSTQVLQYGAAAQNKISKFSDTVLDNVKTKDTGATGDLLAELVGEIKNFDKATGEDEKKGIFGKFSSGKKKMDKLTAKYDSVQDNIEKIEKELEGQKLQMLKDIAVMDTLYEKNLEYFKEISLYIIAGERKIEELKNETLPELQKIAKESNDQIDAQKANDVASMIDRFEKKIYDLKTTRIISIQMAPQIRLIQNNDSELAQKIQSSLTNTIPLWKNQIVIALGINNSKNAMGAQRAVSDITNDMLKKNSEMLKQGTIEVAEESERAIVDVETLQKTNKDIIETLDKVLEIHENGRKKRAEAETQLLGIEQELKDKLLEIKDASLNETDEALSGEPIETEVEVIDDSESEEE